MKMLKKVVAWFIGIPDTSQEGDEAMLFNMIWYLVLIPIDIIPLITTLPRIPKIGPYLW